MEFIPNTGEQQREMLDAVGEESIGALFRDIPEDALLKDLVNIPLGKSELEVGKHMAALSGQNRPGENVMFLGAGCYNHFIPSIVKHLTGRAEFYTAYTPYQAEVSQGSLQALFEFQSLICRVTGMDVANASMYDGASALAETCIMCANITRNEEFVISSTVHPDYREVVKTYANARGFIVKEVGYDAETGLTSLDELRDAVGGKTAGVMIQSPNFFGNIEDMDGVEKIVHAEKALFVACVVEPTSLGILKSPGEYNADIAVGEGQSFGIDMNFGGPFLGFLATNEKYMRQLPARLVGRTKDADNRDGFILTLQAREQHIRREKASSNICTSQSLCAIAAAIYLSALGKGGFKRLGELNLQKAHYAFEAICGLGLKPVFNSCFYNEFAIRFDDAKKAVDELAQNGITAGCDVGAYYKGMENVLLFCVTEVNTREEIDRLVAVLRGCV